MRRLEVRPFSDEFLADAGALLAARHRAHRAAEPLLPERYENADAAAAEVATLSASEAAAGFVALRDGNVVGFVIGTRNDDLLWGANVWVEPAGHAAVDAEDVRDLYAAASAAWVEAGRTRHSCSSRPRTRRSSKHGSGSGSADSTRTGSARRPMSTGRLAYGAPSRET